MDISSSTICVILSASRVDHQLYLLHLSSDIREKEQNVVDYGSTFPTTFI
mgnify:FL=1